MVGVLSVTDPDNYGPAGVWQSHNCSTETAGGRFTVDNNVVKVRGVTGLWAANIHGNPLLGC